MALGLQSVKNRDIVTQNRVHLLDKTDLDEPKITVVVGDSLVRHQNKAFCARVTNERRRCCYPGAKISDIIEMFDDFVVNASPETTYSTLLT